MGLNPSTIYWMDIFSHIFVVKICNVCLKRLKINEKEAGFAHLKKTRIENFEGNNVMIVFNCLSSCTKRFKAQDKFINYRLVML